MSKSKDAAQEERLRFQEWHGPVRADLIKQIKVRAILEDKTMSQIMEEALLAYFGK